MNTHEEKDKPYDQRSHEYYADKLLPKHYPLRTYWGLSRKKAVTELASALQGVPLEVLRAFELEGVKYRNLSIKDQLRCVRDRMNDIPIVPGFVYTNNHKNVYLNKHGINLETFASTAVHESAHVFESMVRGRFQKGVPSGNFVDPTIQTEFENQKKLNKCMSSSAMYNILEFTAEALRGAWGVHKPGADPKGYSGARLRDYAMENAPKTVQYFEAHQQALREFLQKNPQTLHLNMEIIRKNAKDILALAEQRRMTGLDRNGSPQAMADVPHEIQEKRASSSRKNSGESLNPNVDPRKNFTPPGQASRDSNSTKNGKGSPSPRLSTTIR